MLFAASMILFGFIALIWSADTFVSGAASIAKNMGMSPIIIGLTIVAVGTSAPGHAYLGRTLGTLLVSSYALYYHSLQSAL
jgi:Ca2+/Na+ antiporter